MHARDVKGRDAEAALATVWTEPRAFDWRDAVVYEVMVDRYRAKDGSALAAPASMGGRAGGHRRRRHEGHRVGRARRRWA